MNDQITSIYVGTEAEHFDQIFSRLSELPQLRDINVRLVKENAHPDFSSLGKLKHLQKIKISGGVGLEMGLGDAVLKHVTQLPKLRAVDLFECGVTDEGTELLRNLPRLERLSIYQEARLTDRGIQSIAKISRK